MTLDIAMATYRAHDRIRTPTKYPISPTPASTHSLSKSALRTGTGLPLKNWVNTDGRITTYSHIGIDYRIGTDSCTNTISRTDTNSHTILLTPSPELTPAWSQPSA